MLYNENTLKGTMARFQLVLPFAFLVHSMSSGALDLIALSLSTDFQIQSSHSSDIYLVATKLKTQIQFLFILKMS